MRKQEKIGILITALTLCIVGIFQAWHWFNIRQEQASTSAFRWRLVPIAINDSAFGIYNHTIVFYTPPFFETYIIYIYENDQLLGQQQMLFDVRKWSMTINGTETGSPDLLVKANI